MQSESSNDKNERKKERNFDWTKETKQKKPESKSGYIPHVRMQW